MREGEGDHLLYDEQEQEVQRLKKGHYEIPGPDGKKIIAVSDDPDAPWNLPQSQSGPKRGLPLESPPMIIPVMAKLPSDKPAGPPPRERIA